jgi:hypothetical protein
MSVCYECWVLSVGGLCDESITRPEESYRCVVCYECCVLSGRGLCVGLITGPEESYGCLSVMSVVCCQVEEIGRASCRERVWS